MDSKIIVIKNNQKCANTVKKIKEHFDCTPISLRHHMILSIALQEGKILLVNKTTF